MNIFTFIFSYLTIDYICTMVNRYIFKESPQLGRSHEDDEKENQE